MRKKYTLEQKRLIRRYLIWFYKTIKEEIDRTDRKFTQLAVDDFVLTQLEKMYKSIPSYENEQYAKCLDNFKDYIQQKREEAFSQKFAGPNKKFFRVDYLYLKNRLLAVENAIVYFLGAKALDSISTQYEEEMISRILQSKEHC